METTTRALRVERGAVPAGDGLAASLRRAIEPQRKYMHLPAAEAAFGLSHTKETLRQKIAETVSRPISELRFMWAPVERYHGYIPDAALLRYDEARRADLFGAFHVIEVHVIEVNADPWLVGEIAGRFIVLAYWD